MSERTISLDLGPDAAEAYGRAPEDVRRKIDLLLRVQVLRALGLPSRSMEEIMESASRQAAESDLSPEKLQAILNER